MSRHIVKTCKIGNDIFEVSPLCHKCIAWRIEKIQAEAEIIKKKLVAIETNAVAKYIAPKHWHGKAFEMEEVEILLLQWGLPGEIVIRIMYYYIKKDEDHCRLNRKISL